MSAIGDYIHYTASGYEKHGITKDGNFVAYNYAIMKNNIMKRINSSQLTSKDKEQLQKALNNILSDNDKSGSVESKIRTEIQNILEEQFMETLGKIDWETGNISAASVQTSKEGTKSKITTDANQDSIQLKTILSRIRALEGIRDNLGTSAKKTELTQKIQEIYVQLNYILTNGKKIGKLTELKNTKLEGMTNNKLISINSLGENEDNLITKINTLMKAYAATPAINLQKGTLFEYVIALAPAIARVNAGENLEDVLNELKQSVVGDARSQIEINFDKNDFTKDIDINQLSLKNYAVSDGIGGRTAIAYNASQEKIDIILSWNGKYIPISAKNIKLNSGYDVHILSGSSLLYLIQDESPDFVNHYFNIVAEHGSFVNGEPINNSDKINQNYQAAHEAMKYILFFKAISGQTYGRQGAEIFLVNDNSQEGGIRILEIADIVQKAVDNLDKFAIITSNGEAIENISIKNNWSSSGYSERITNFINSVHQQKISASIKASTIREM